MYAVGRRGRVGGRGIYDKFTDFRKAVQAKDGDDIVLSWIEWVDKLTRDAAMER